MSQIAFDRRRLDDLSPSRRQTVDGDALEVARRIVADVRDRGIEAVREHARRFDDLEPGADLFVDEDELAAAVDEVDDETTALFERVRDRIARFARAQRGALDEVEVPLPGGRAGHDVEAVERAGCYAPGGRYPLPSSVLMTATTAGAAGVDQVWLATPSPTPVVRAAASIAGADGLLACGGAQAIAGLAHGAGRTPPCDVVVGPGNRWVTAAKQTISGAVEIDMLAGPSELVVFADTDADPRTAAADLLAQAEHDADALPVLVATDEGVVDAVESALANRLDDLPTAETARAALAGGFAVVVESREEGVRACNRIAPEHLEVLVRDAADLAGRIDHYGTLFIDEGAAEVLGDYGAGPNHTLPTGGTARSTGGLSVFDFLRIRTWMAIDSRDDAAPLARDAATFARLESLEAHARSAEWRLDDSVEGEPDQTDP